MSIKDQYKILEFGDLGDERGKLVVVEGDMDIPFEIKRVFYIYGSDSSVIPGAARQPGLRVRPHQCERFQQGARGQRL